MLNGDNRKISLLSGSPLSATRLPSRREDLYDMTDYSWVSIRFYLERSGFTPQMALAVRTMCFQKLSI
jgi:hypothetical protein